MSDDRPFSKKYPEGHARIVDALHRYNVGPDWTRAECVDLVRAVERLRADHSDALRQLEEARAEILRLMEDRDYWANRLRLSDLPLPQFCSKEHRALHEAARAEGEPRG